MTYEDFTTYIEVDEGNDITVTSSKIDWVAMLRDVSSYVYKDFGAGTFGDVDHDFEAQIDTSEHAGTCAHWVLANLINNFFYFYANYSPAIAMRSNQDTGVYRFSIWDFESRINDAGVVSVGTLYYNTITRVGTTLTMNIYTDAARTNLHDTLAITCTTTTFRYLYACSSWDTGTASYAITGFTQNFDIPEAPPPPAAIMQPRKYW